jgi:hypothetical protein
MAKKFHNEHQGTYSTTLLLWVIRVIKHNVANLDGYASQMEWWILEKAKSGIIIDNSFIHEELQCNILHRIVGPHAEIWALGPFLRSVLPTLLQLSRRCRAEWFYRIVL